MWFKYFGLYFLVSSYSHGFIIPQEVPSLLSLVYSNIPPVKKGTDSRFGVGFRLGEHADFQVLVELGPQKFTKPIGNEAGSSSKRHVDQDDYDVIPPLPKTKGEKWLSNWSNNIKQPDYKEQQPEQQHGSYVMPFIPEDSLKQLQLLYGLNRSPSTLNNQPSITLNIQDSTIKTENNMSSSSIKMPEFRPIMKKNVKSKEKITAELMDVDLE